MSDSVQEGDGDLSHLAMLYPEFVDEAMRSQEPVTEIREVGEYRSVYSAATYEPERELVWRADIDADFYPDYDSTPTVGFAKCRPTVNDEYFQKWSSIATGRLSGPKDLASWEQLLTVFNTVLGFYRDQRENHEHYTPEEETDV